jgi:putative ABC transport system permease protein
VRSLWRTRLFTVATIVTIGLGAGVTALFLDAVDRLYLRAPSGVRDASDLRRLEFARTLPRLGRRVAPVTSYPVFDALKTGTGAFAGVAAYADQTVILGVSTEAAQVDAEYVSDTYFPTLGVAPQLGRGPTAAEAGPSGAPIVVISHGVWVARLGRDPEVLRRDLLIDGEPRRIIGVMPPGFAGLDPAMREVAVWLPLGELGAKLGAADWHANANSYVLSVVSRLPRPAQPERSVAEASAIFRTVAGLDAQRPDQAGVVLAPLHRSRGPHAAAIAPVAPSLAATAILVCIVACITVAHLAIARTTRRREEMAVREALGASRWHLFALLAREQTVLLTLGVGGAVLVAAWGGGLIHTLLLTTAAAPFSPWNARFLLLTLLLATAAGLVGVVASFVSTLRATRERVHAAAGPRTLGAGGAGVGVRRGLLVAQVALAFMLVFSAALFLRSLRNVQAVDLGLRVSDVVVVTPVTSALRREPAAAADLLLRMREQVRQTTGVAAASITGSVPFVSSFGQSVVVPERDALTPSSAGGPYINVVDAGYFATLGQPMVEGRAFNEGDRAGSHAVAIVNEAMARWLWPDADPLGRCFRLSAKAKADACLEVVGVAADSKRQQVTEPRSPQFYVPLGQQPAWLSPTAVIVRMQEGGGRHVASLRASLSAVNRDLLTVDVQQLSDLIEPQFRQWSVSARAIGLIAALGLVLAAFALYGVLAFETSARRSEIGVRTALGASSRDMLWLFARRAGGVVLAGTLTGALFGVLLQRALGSVLFGLPATDGISILIAAAVVLLTSSLASWIPLVQATRVDPTQALRAD